MSKVEFWETIEMEGDSRIKCRLHFGQLEFEIESDSGIDSRIIDEIVEILGLMKGLISEALATENPLDILITDQSGQPLGKESPEGSESKKEKTNRGGRRIPIIPDKIQELGAKGKIKNVTAGQVVTMIKEEYGIPVKEDAVYAALLRQLQKSLIRTGTEMKNSEFTYIEKSVESKGEVKPLVP